MFSALGREATRRSEGERNREGPATVRGGHTGAKARRGGEGVLLVADMLVWAKGDNDDDNNDNERTPGTPATPRRAVGATTLNFLSTAPASHSPSRKLGNTRYACKECAKWRDVRWRERPAEGEECAHGLGGGGRAPSHGNRAFLRAVT
jgi:hypothetical protein